MTPTAAPILHVLKQFVAVTSLALATFGLVYAADAVLPFPGDTSGALEQPPTLPARLAR